MLSAISDSQSINLEYLSSVKFGNLSAVWEDDVAVGTEPYILLEMQNGSTHSLSGIKDIFWFLRSQGQKRLWDYIKTEMSFACIENEKTVLSDEDKKFFAMNFLIPAPNLNLTLED